MRSLSAAISIGLLSLAGCDGVSERQKRSRSETYTLYRDSGVDAGMRLHVATFDADDRDDYNRDMCEIVRGFFAERPYMGSRYWCEGGRYRERPD